MVKFDVSYVRDKLGRIKTKTESLLSSPARVFEYQYDFAGRLKEVKENGLVTSTYTYDANGNRQNSGALYDAQDRLTSTNTANYTYNLNGELETRTESGLVTTYTYDVLGNLKKVILSDSREIEYVVDGRNRRIGKIIDGVLEKKWLYMDDINPIMEWDWDNVGQVWIEKRFVYASRANVPDFMIIPAGQANAGTYRIISDHLGSPRLILDIGNGNLISQLDYDDWGKVLLSSQNIEFQPFGFAGGLYDPDTKLVRFGMRDYDPELGRWTTKDTVRFDGDGTNLYGYALNDPVNSIDLLGLWSRKAHNAIIDEFGKRVGLSPQAIAQMKIGSLWADARQLPGQSHWHAQTDVFNRNKGKTCLKANELIKKKMAEFWTHKDFYALGMAMHPAMDTTSPAHRGFSRYYYWSSQSQHSSDPNVFGRATSSLEGIVDLTDELKEETVLLMIAIYEGEHLIDCSCYNQSIDTNGPWDFLYNWSWPWS